MFRDFLKQSHSSSKFGFRYRGLETSRIENLTDAVFAFAITLLVIASEVPNSYVELQASMYDFIGFIFCALLIFGIWNNHYNFFRCYGMQDKLTKSLNFIFIFVLLFYIYPLKYLFSYLGSALFITFLKEIHYTSPAMQMALEKIQAAHMNSSQWTDLMIRFSLGLFFIYLILFFMHLNALKKRKLLDLNPLEVYETKCFMISYLFLVFIAVFSITIVSIGGGAYAPHAGFTFCTIPIFLPLFRKFQVKKIKKKYAQYIPEKRN